MQLDYPSVAAVWSEPQENVIGFTTTNRGLSGGDGTMAVADRAAAHNRQLLGKALARAPWAECWYSMGAANSRYG